MQLIALTFLLVLFNSGLLLAQTPAPQPSPGFLAQLVAMTPMFLMIMGIFYFLVVLPQKKELKRHHDFIAGLKKGTEVVTSGGIIAKVSAVEKDHILLDLGGNVKMKCEIAHVKRASGVDPSKEQKAA